VRIDFFLDELLGQIPESVVIRREINHSQFPCGPRRHRKPWPLMPILGGKAPLGFACL
jgi:hypothetical protein